MLDKVQRIRSVVFIAFGVLISLSSLVEIILPFIMGFDRLGGYLTLIIAMVAYGAASSNGLMFIIFLALLLLYVLIFPFCIIWGGLAITGHARSIPFRAFIAISTLSIFVYSISCFTFYSFFLFEGGRSVAGFYFLDLIVGPLGILASASYLGYLICLKKNKS
jgi:hypothetical protein